MSSEGWNIICPNCGEVVEHLIGVAENLADFWLSLNKRGRIDIENWEPRSEVSNQEGPDYYRCPECGEDLIIDEVIDAMEEWGETPEGKAKRLKDDA